MPLAQSVMDASWHTRSACVDYGKSGGNRNSARGVYTGVFEQSVLIESPSSRYRSVLASLTGELALLTLAILIPLISSDQLPRFVWQAATVTAPPPPAPQKMDTKQIARRASGTLSIRRIFIDPLLRRPSPKLSSLDPPSIDAPPGVPGATGLAGNGPAIPIFEKPVQPAAPPAPARPAEAKTPPTPIRVSSGVQMAKLVRQVLPVYPPMAKAMRISGVVHLTGVIGKDGRLERLQLISGHPMLAQAAIDAVREWIYKPTLLNGEPVEVIAPIDVVFTLTQ